MSREYVLQIVFWGSLGLLVYTFVGYAVLVWVIAKLFGRRERPKPGISMPTVTVVMAAYNEQGRISDRLTNIFQSDYPGNKLDIIVVSDGSTDETAARACALNDSRIRVISNAHRSGKAACLNIAMAAATGDIIVFADVRQRFAADAISKLVHHFSDPTVGAVSGSLEIDPSGSSVGGGVDVYWKLEKAIRYYECCFDSSIGCTGAIYAIRRELFRDLPADTLLDDVVTPMQIALQKRRIIFEPAALAFDPQSLEPEREWIRKQRTLAGNYQMLFRYWRWLLPWQNRLWWQLISHKYLRLAAPGFMLLLVVVNLALVMQPFYKILFVGQCCFYGLAGCGVLLKGRRPFIVSIPAGFVFLNLTVVRGLWHYMFRPSQPGWQSAHQKSEQKTYV